MAPWPIPLLNVALLPMLALAGCRAAPRAAPASPGAGLVWMFPGIRGTPGMLSGAQRAFRDAGVTAHIEILDWHRSEFFGELANLLDHETNRRRAADIAERIAAFHQDQPDTTIDLIGYSGGGGLALMVAEALPENVPLRHVILVQSAVSPDYDLGPTLSRLQGKLVNFHSPADWFFLGVGTTLFGTMDRRAVASAGKDGFDPEQAVKDPRLRSRLEQPRWTPEMIFDGHNGGHLGMFRYQWNKKYIAPWLAPPSPGMQQNAADKAD